MAVAESYGHWSSATQRRGGRVVEGNGLENRQRASVRGFESHPLRCPVVKPVVRYRRPLHVGH